MERVNTEAEWTFEKKPEGNIAGKVPRERPRDRSIDGIKMKMSRSSF
jgi:hypothetical protein